MESKKKQIIETEIRFVVVRGGGWGVGELGEGDLKVQTSIINKYWGHNL